MDPVIIAPIKKGIPFIKEKLAGALKYAT